ncbi:hypothetical protein BHM03_00043822, partial [Ensete ventricosum]
HQSPAPTIATKTKVLANYNRYPSSTLAATNRCHLLPSSSIAVAIASSSSLPLSLAIPQQYTASIDVVASPTLFPAFLSPVSRCPLPRSHHHPTQRRTIADHLCSSSPHLLSTNLWQRTTLVVVVTRRLSLSFTRLLSQCTRASAISLPSLSSLSLPPCCPTTASLVLSHAFLPLHLHHHRCQLPDPMLPNLFPAVATIASHNRCPSPISSSACSVAIAASPHSCHLSPIAAATRRCLLPCRYCLTATTISNHAFAAAPPCCHRCNSLLPLLPPPSPTSFSIYR